MSFNVNLSDAKYLNGHDAYTSINSSFILSRYIGIVKPCVFLNSDAQLKRSVIVLCCLFNVPALKPIGQTSTACASAI